MGLKSFGICLKIEVFLGPFPVICNHGMFVKLNLDTSSVGKTARRNTKIIQSFGL